MSGYCEVFANQINKTKRFCLSHHRCDDALRQNDVCTTPGDYIKMIRKVTFMPALSGLFFAR